MDPQTPTGMDDNMPSSPTTDQQQQAPKNNYALLPGPLPPNPKWDPIIEKIYNNAWAAVTEGEEAGWKFHDEQQGVKIYLRPLEGITALASKGIATIDSDIETIRCVFACSDVRKEWDNVFGGSNITEMLDPNTLIASAHFKLPWPLTSRDFLTLGRSIILPNNEGVFVFFGSVEHPNCPPEKKFVRGELYYSATLLKPNAEDPTKTDIIYSLAQDPKGSLPVSLVQAAAVQQPMCCNTIAELIKNKPTIVQSAIAIERAKFEAACAAMAQKTAETSSSTGSGGVDDANGDTTNNNTNNGDSNNNGGDIIIPGKKFKLAEDGMFNQQDYTISVVPPNDELLTPYQKELLDAAFNKAWPAMADDDEGWSYYKEIEGVKIWLKPSGVGPVKLSKGHGVIPHPPAIVASIFGNDGTRSLYDTMFAGGRAIEVIDTNTFTGYAAFSAPFPLSGRDFTAITRSVLLADGSIFNYSADYITPKAPPTNKYVRGKLLFSGMLIIPIEDGKKSKIIYAIGSDPSGDLPASIAEVAALSQPLCIASVNKALSKTPDMAQRAFNEHMTRYNKIISATGMFNISKEVIPSIGTIEWPVYDEVLQAAASAEDDKKWLLPLHQFAEQTTLQQIQNSLSYASQHGGLFRTLSPDYTPPSSIISKNIDTSTTTTNTNNNATFISQDDQKQQKQSTNIGFGKLALKVTHLRGKYLTILSNMKLYFTLTFENQQQRTEYGPHIPPKSTTTDDTKKDKDNKDTTTKDNKKEKEKHPIFLKSPSSGQPILVSNMLCCDITRPDSVLCIELWGEQYNEQRNIISSACLGVLRLTIGELFEGNANTSSSESNVGSNNAFGSGDPTRARRFWLPLSGVPMELDRSCTHYELIHTKTKSGQKLLTMADGSNSSDTTATGSSSNTSSPSSSSLQYLNDPRGLFICFESCIILSPIKMFFNDFLSFERIHASTTAPMSVYNSMELCLPPQLCQEPRELLQIAHPIKNPELCTKVGQIGFILTGGSLLTTDLINQEDLTQTITTFSAHLFVRNIIRFFFALTPFVDMGNILYDLLFWKSPISTLFTIFCWIFLCFNPLFILPIISLFIIYIIMMNNATYHFLQAAARANTTYAQAVKQKYQLALNYAEQLHIMIPTLSPRVQATGLLIQVVTGRLAMLFEQINSLFTWTRVNDNALTMAIIMCITLCTSSYICLCALIISSSSSTSLLSNGIINNTLLNIQQQQHNNNNMLNNLFNSFSLYNNHNIGNGWSMFAIFVPLVLCVAWNNSLMLRLKQFVGSLFRTHARILLIRREAKTVKLMTNEVQQ